jgi:hypothetical protein
MRSDPHGVVFLRYFVRHQQEIYACILTLVTTCTEEAGHSWCFFGEPMLDLAVKAINN